MASELAPSMQRPLALNDEGAYDDLRLPSTTRYETFCRYPFIVREITLWTPAGTESETVLQIIRSCAGDLLVRSELLNRFEKGNKVSLAFRLIFQSSEKTLTDAEVNAVMERISPPLKARGFEDK